MQKTTKYIPDTAVPAVLIAGLLAVVLIVTFRSKPYFGNMDDSGFLQLAAEHDPVNFARLLMGGSDLGFIRYSSMLLVWPAYWFGVNIGPVPYFMFNAVVVMLVLLFFGYAITRLLQLRGAWPVVGFAAVSLSWPYTAELFFFPSLSEKGIILGAGLLFLWVAARSHIKFAALYWLSFAFVVAFAFTAKMQILVFVPAVLLAVWVNPAGAKQPQSLKRNLIATVVLILSSLTLLIMALSGGYTRSTQGNLSADFIRDQRFLLLLGVTIFYTLALLVRLALHKNRAIEWVPALMLISMSAAFAVWEIRNYFLSIAGVMVASAFVVVVGWVGKDWLRVGLVTIVVVLAATWLTFRLPTVYGSLASVGEFLNSKTASEIETSGGRIYVSCLEAPEHYNFYAQSAGYRNLEFLHLDGSLDQSPSLDPEVTEYIFADSRLCPLSRGMDSQNLVWSSDESQAFQLFTAS